MPPRRVVLAAVQATSARGEFAGAGWDMTRALMPFSNELANILVQSSIAPPGLYDHDHHAPLPTAISTNLFDLLALSGIMLNVVQIASLHGQKKGMRVGLTVALLAFIVPNSMLALATDMVVGCTLGSCPGVIVGGKMLKSGRLVAGLSIVWMLETLIELAKELICHPGLSQQHLKALLPLSAALGWTAALHVGLRHGKSAFSSLKSAFASAASKLHVPPQPRPTPSSPPPTPEKAAAKAAAAQAARATPEPEDAEEPEEEAADAQ
mmetsp:Transcript_4507/g.11569  ORF Transcript_4507/g.11569 Transcript_4507/m.11569 type:complete len:266 (-) Transcript_4507:161-958(-)|eukprot:CAMPEP_0179945916 /NCGR_PEP_ID=MMETSP0983-20121128/20015_1 /TAXON_ID=483367 /ORGANISM="non described non described, Strain CCMP 2436" /LENGTH=265 /DNA_ID=CAMNT_0021854537 /DNA_START=73 /DNA_END=870 /DNA_ORIENTATION=+